MLRITQSKGAAGAVKYFDKGLAKSDYYSDHGETIGHWQGKGAELLGLTGEVDRDQFKDLAYNKAPGTDERLTSMNNDNRTVGYDFTFSVPKSVSLVYAVTKDKDILDAIEAAKTSAMESIEENAETRVRKGGKNEDRKTGNLIYATFTHDDARPVNGIPDPHLHQHVFVFNATYDQQEEKWKAGQFRNLKADGQYYETIFNSHLASNLVDAGYSLDRNKRDFEIAGFQRSTIEKFSNRTRQVELEAEKRGLVSDKIKSELGGKTRAKKDTNYTKEELELQWSSRLSDDEKEKIASAKKPPSNEGESSVKEASEKKEIAAKKAVDHALEHALERKSVVDKKELSILAMKRGYGTVSSGQISEAISKREDLISKKKDGQTFFTTKEALAEERKLRDSARAGKGEFKPINPNFKPFNDQLTKEQTAAVKHVLTSKDLITTVSGGAGTGKTWSIKEVRNGVARAGKAFGAFAPSSAASRQVQREDGFENATTIAALLQSPKLQESVKDGVIWIDEAGMVGNKTMNHIIHVAGQQNARILLTGDVKQHGSVERGDALRIIEKYGGVKPARINKIQRQKKDSYRAAVKSISDGHIEKGYGELDKMGAFTEAEDFNQVKENVAKEYVSTRKAKEEALIVATTHKQGKAVTEAVRDKLKEKKIIGKRERKVEVLSNLSFTDAEKKDVVNYETGQAIQFHQNSKGDFKRGSRFSVKGKDDDGNIQVVPFGSKDKEATTLPLHEAKKYSVYGVEEIGVAKGDKIRITQNGFAEEKKRLNNGNVLSVKGFDKKGRIIASNGRNDVKLPADYGHLTHGYYSTSPASQGKSVNRVIMVQTSASGRAANKEQFYVSASRGKFAISIHTDDKEGLLQSVKRSSERMTATEIAKPQNPAERVSELKDKFKKFGQIYQAAKSKVASTTKEWHNKAMMSLSTKPQQQGRHAGPTKTR